MPPALLADLTPTPIWQAALVSYLLGAVPFGLLMARVIKGVDLRSVGSGNIGATNAMRVLGKPLGLVAFAFDLGKGYAAVRLIAPNLLLADDLSVGRIVCATAAVLGHCFPIYLRLKGGKGVATGCGAIMAVEPLVFVAGGVAWLVTLTLSRFVGLASMVMGLCFPLAALWLRPGDRPFALGCALLAFLVLVRHRANVGRMLRGEEPRVGRSKTKVEHK